jgi:hypothetical protein
LFGWEVLLLLEELFLVVLWCSKDAGERFCKGEERGKDMGS